MPFTLSKSKEVKSELRTLAKVCRVGFEKLNIPVLPHDPMGYWYIAGGVDAICNIVAARIINIFKKSGVENEPLFVFNSDYIRRSLGMPDCRGFHQRLSRGKLSEESIYKILMTAFKAVEFDIAGHR